jgi:hypothetical protein
MAGETDQNLPIADDNKSTSGVESYVPAMSSSSNAAAVKMADKIIPKMLDYWKKSWITEVDRLAFHSSGWLGSGLESIIPEVDIPMVGGSTIICFESHLIAGLGFPPSKFLVGTMNFLGCELVHLNLNVIATLSCFIKLCECWLGIASDTSLF